MFDILLKRIFSVFKQYYTYFYIFFYSILYFLYMFDIYVFLNNIYSKRIKKEK